MKKRRNILADILKNKSMSLEEYKEEVNKIKLKETIDKVEESTDVENVIDGTN